MADDRTVLHALPEDQPDGLSVGQTSGPSVHVAEANQESAAPPARSTLKTEWKTYAETQGVNTDGLTKDEIIDAVGS